MATLTTGKVASTVQARAGTDITAVFETYSLSAALALNDVIQMVKIPAGATVLDLTIACDDLDSNGTPTIVLDVGDGDDTDRFIDGSTIGQAGGSAKLGAGVATGNAAFNYTYTTADTIDVLVQAGPATGATSGQITMSVIYTMQS
jgi:hypothetical protein